MENQGVDINIERKASKTYEYDYIEATWTNETHFLELEVTVGTKTYSFLSQDTQYSTPPIVPFESDCKVKTKVYEDEGYEKKMKESEEETHYGTKVEIMNVSYKNGERKVSIHWKVTGGTRKVSTYLIKMNNGNKVKEVKPRKDSGNEEREDFLIPGEFSNAPTFQVEGIFDREHRVISKSSCIKGERIEITSCIFKKKEETMKLIIEWKGRKDGKNIIALKSTSHHLICEHIASNDRFDEQSKIVKFEKVLPLKHKKYHITVAERGNPETKSSPKPVCSASRFEMRSSAMESAVPVIGATLLAIAAAFIVDMYTNLSGRDDSLKSVLILLSILINLGIIAYGVRIFINICYYGDNRWLSKTYNNHSSFNKIKFIFFCLFGTGFALHCVIFLVYHKVVEKSKNIRTEGMFYNISALVFTLLQVVYVQIFLPYIIKNKFLQSGTSALIIVANFGIWLDAIFSEASGVFDASDIHVENQSYIGLLQEKNNETDKNELYPIEEFKEKTEVILSPMLIEFCLMAVGFIFPKKQDDEHIKLKINVEFKPTILFQFVQMIVFIGSSGFFLFAIYVFVTEHENKHSGKIPESFENYTIYQIIVKSLMLILVIGLLYWTWIANQKYERKIISHGISFSILLLSCFGNIIYHSLNFIILLQAKSSLGKRLSLADQGLSIGLALLQTSLLLDAPLYLEDMVAKGNASNKEKIALLFFSSYLSFCNFGLWAADSIGEIRKPVFTEIAYRALASGKDGKRAWEVITKLIFPVTIFFRFHSAMDFLELWREFNIE